MAGRPKAFPDIFFILCVAVMIIAGWLALRENSEEKNRRILMESIDSTLSQIRADFAADPNYKNLGADYDDSTKNPKNPKNPWGDFIVRQSAEDGGAGSSHIQIRLTRIPDSVCADLLKTLAGDGFLIHVIEHANDEHADDSVRWNQSIREGSRTCKGFANQPQNAMQLLALD